VRHAALANDPKRVTKRARIRHLLERLPNNAARFFADELDIPTTFSHSNNSNVE
jgi:hypothetical protein